MIGQLTPYIPTLQKYLLAQDRNAFKNSLKAESKERILLDLLTLSFEKQIDISTLKEKLTEIGLMDYQADQFLNQKKMNLLKKAKTKGQIEMIFKLIENQLGQMHEFNHPKPIDIVNLDKEEVSENRTPNEANFPQSYQQILEEKIKLINQNKNLQIFSNFGIKQLGYEALMKLDYRTKQNVLFTRLDFLRTFDDKFVIEFIRSFLEDKRAKQNLNYSLPDSLYALLTKSQLQVLLDAQPDISKDFNYMKYWYKQNYVERLQDFSKNAVLTISQKQEKRKLLLEIRQGVKKFKTLITKSLEEQTFMELLILDLSLQNPKKDLFLQFLQNMYVPCNILSEKYNSKVQIRNQQQKTQQAQMSKSKLRQTDIQIQDGGTNWHGIHHYEMASWTHDKLISQYLVGLFKMQNNPDELANILMSYLNQDFVLKICAKVKLTKGQTVPNINNILKAHQIADLRDKKKISILSKNKKIFKVDEEVILTIRVKNVKSIRVKIYELNLEKSYLEKQNKIDQNMNLSFLEPTRSFDYEVQNTNPFKQALYDMPIKQIYAKQAVYIVDLQGEGVSSRAVIRKGGIVCLKKTTVAGLELKFYDEQGKRITQLDLWVNSKKESVKDSYTIPFGKTLQNLNLIAVKDSYAELINVVVEAESYQWEIGYIYGSQSFIVGNKAKIAIHPRLKLQQEYIGLKILTKSKIAVQTVNSQDIKSYYSFDNIEWCSKSDYIVQFPIQSYIKSISITVTAEIPLYCGDKFKLQDTKVINIELNENIFNYINAYLNKSNDCYWLYLLGQNGQAIPNTDLIIDAKLLGVREGINKLLRTNSQGCVKLGKLSLVTSLSVSVQTQSTFLTRNWVIRDQNQQINYVNCTNYKKGEKISLPTPLGMSMDDVVILKKGIDGLINSNVTHFASITDSRLNIEGLEAGTYEVEFISLETKINIVVLSGKQWEAANQVYSAKKETVYQIVRSANHLVGLGQATTEDKGEKISVSVKLNIPECGLSQSIRAHVLIENYHSPAIEGQFNPSSFVNTPKTISQKFALKQNQYYNNKTLSDEGSYVQNRQNQKKFIGNNLEKPRIFLKRFQVRDTCQQQEVLAKEGAFYPSNTSASVRRADQKFADRRRQLSVVYPSSIDAHNNFLASPGILSPNLKGDTIKFEIPKGYNHFKVYLLSNDGAIRKDYSINQKNVGKLKDLRHVGIKDQNEQKGWTMSREIYHLHEGDTFKISRDSRWSAVSLSNIATFAQIKASKVKEWVTGWSSYSKQKKIECYERQFSHEINTFIKENDPQFFKTIVRPFIDNKVIKTLVDYALLDDEKCESYASIEQLQKLNDFQKILLIQYLLKHEKADRAKEIAKSMELKQRLTKISFDEFKKQFDTVINSKKTADIPPQPPQQFPSSSYQGGLFGAPGGGNYQNQNNSLFGEQNQYQHQQQYLGQMNQMSFDPFSNVGYIQPSYNVQQMSYAPPPQSFSAPPPVGLNNWAMDARNMSYNNEKIPVQQAAFGSMKSAPMKKMAVTSKNSYDLMDIEMNMMDDETQNIKLREKFKQGFKGVEKTKQYTQTTYKGIKSIQQSTYLIASSSFWSTLAIHLIEKPNVKFLTDTFMYLNSEKQFTLGMCFLKNGVNADFDLNNEGQSIVITAKNSFSIFVKEVRPTNYIKKFGVMINQRFFDPFNRYTYQEDGTAIEKEVEQFIVRKIYSYQTVVTNTSGTNLELQLLLDVPQGSIPIQSHQYTQIKSVNISPYSTSSFDRSFYFPSEGKFSMYPANACRGKEIISKGPSLALLEVKPFSTVIKMDSFNDIIRLGNQTDVLQFLTNKNIFDPNIFNADSILWMLKNKTVFEKVIGVLRARCYFHQTVWSYSILHKQMQGIKELLERQSISKQLNIPIFEYFPYFSSRTHKFLNESKSTIRNVQFKNTYHKFLISLIFNGTQTSVQKITFLYYLLLQDRIEQASNLYSKLTEDQKNSHRLQADYFQCFLDMYEGYPSFVKARKISTFYVNYPITAWRNLFKEVYDLLKDFDSVTYVEEEAKAQFKTVIIKEISQIRISIPPDTKIQVYFFPINLELYFSQFPFSKFKEFSSVKPYQSVTFPSGISREEKVPRPQNAKDIVVQIYQSKQGKPAEKLDSFHWTHPDLKIKINQSKGNAQVFFKGKQYPGCYCKVYSSGKAGEKFYRDGYTDITGTFKYVLADFEDITKFNILFTTDHGGLSMEAKPPSTAGTLPS